jgi:hypothetical protein
MLDEHGFPNLTKSSIESLSEGIAKLQVQLTEAKELLGPIRDGLGGHVRPNNANPDKAKEGVESYETRGLRELAEWPGVVTLNTTTPLGTSYRQFTVTALLFTWVDVRDDKALEKKLEEFQPKVMDVTTSLLAAIDGVLYAFWLAIGVIEPIRATAAR